ncbi:Zn-dependent oxidoreductase [Escherichia coli]
MKIVKAEVFVTCPGRNFVTLKITTEDGITGLGDATLNGRELSVASYLQDHLCPQLIGRDAHRIEDIWQFFYKGAYWRRGPVTMSAISAVDMALWDIKAKAANMPLYQLLGGASREGVMVYCHTTGHSIDEALDDYARHQELGFKAIRVQCGIPGMKTTYGMSKGKGLAYEPATKGQWPEEQLWSTEKYLDFMPKLFDAVRNKFGFNEHLLHDMHHRLTPIEAARFGKSIEDYRMFWMEDPTPAENQECFRLIRQHTVTPIAVGEVFNSIWDCKQLIEEQLIDYIRTTLTHAGGICGSDSHIYRGHNPFAKYPRVIGHEFFGVIDAVGEGVESARVGERVAVDPVVSCGHCYPCSIGKPNVCTTLAVLGVHADGGFSEYAVVPAKNAWKIPEAVADQYAVMIEPFTIAANVTGHGQPTENDTVLVYGAGPIGLTIVQVLKGVYNVKNVIVADRIDERLEKAKESGADWAINNSQTPLGEIFAEKGIKPTLIIDAACHPSILKEAVTLASPAARIVLMGFSSEPSEVIQQGITGKELSIFSSRLNANKFPVVIDWLSKGLIKPEKLITHTFDFQHVADAISLFEQDQKHCCKVLLTFSE